MSGFTKLVPEIIQSSIWNESSDIRIVWIAMLATKDQDGYVRGDAQTIARMANVPLESAITALDKFQQPDSNSHTATDEGRRIEKADGGYMVINHDLYREIGMSESNREYWREKQRIHREKKQNVNDKSKTSQRLVTDSSVSVSVSDTSIVLDKGVQGEKVEKTFKQLTNEEFVSQCQTLSDGILDEEDAIAFCRYWVEPNTKGKMKFQLQKTWDIKLRMHTWKANGEKFAERKSNGSNG